MKINRKQIIMFRNLFILKNQWKNTCILVFTIHENKMLFKKQI